MGLASLAGCAVWAPAPQLSHGVATAVTSPDRAQVWARCSAPGEVEVHDSASDRRWRAPAEAAADHTARVALDGLAAGRAHAVQVRCRRGWRRSAPATARFRTPPPPAAAVAVRLAWGGDVGGQNVCRDARRGYPIFDRLRAVEPDLFVALGDMVYADSPCLPVGRYGNAQVPGPAAPAVDLAGYRAHWRYNRADPATQRLLASTAVVPIWDDHEIRNDGGPRDDRLALAPTVALFPIAARAYREYQPLDDGVLYRRLRWGRHLELFVLDTRSYRDDNRTADDGPEAKTLLGEAQRRWLVDGLRTSTATWKVVVSSVPLAIPTGGRGRDGWADGGGPTGFERELLALLRAVRDARNLLWLTTDVHFAAAFRYAPFPAEPAFVFHELITGPLNAGFFPSDALDPTLRPTRLYRHGPEPGTPIADYDAALDGFTFGTLDIDSDGHLEARVITARGATAYRLALTPTN